MRPALNRPAARALLMSRVAGVALLVIVVMVVFSDSSGMGPLPLWAASVFGILVVVILGCAVAGICFGIIGVRQPPSRGGKGAATFAIVQLSCLLLAIGAVSVAPILLALALRR